MTGRAYHLLVNPLAGGGRAIYRGEMVAAALRAAGADVTVERSTSRMGCAEQVAAAGAGRVVVAVGGDGMVGSVAGAVVRTGHVLGIVPAGRGNDFARQLGIPPDPAEVARLLLTGSPRRVDVLAVRDRVVVGSVYAGIDSRASRIVDGSQWLPNVVQYPVAAVLALLTHRPTTYELVLDGTARRLDAFTVVVANSGYYGTGMHIAPSALVDDGYASVVVIARASRLRLVLALRRLYDGSHVRLPVVQQLTAREVVMASTGAVIAYGDGECIGPLPVSVRVLPGALRVIS